MKTLLTSSLLTLLAITMMAPAQASGIVSEGQGYGLIGVIAPIDDAAQALGELKAADDDQAILIGLLLPAVQKVRDAANRSASACPGEADVKDSVDFVCAAEKLSAMILDSQTGRDGSPGLLNLVAESTGTSIKSAKLFVRKQGTEAAPGTEQMIIAILIGLLREVDDAKIADGSVREPLVAAIKIADDIDPDHTSAAASRTGYDLVQNKKL